MFRLRGSGSLRYLRQFSSEVPYKGNNVLGIVREVFSPWERRSPLCPHHVKSLVRQGVRVLVQPCTKRIFSNKEFQDAGAEIKEDINEACLQIGVKQFPISSIQEGKSYLFFSHVIKAQPKNMPLLDHILNCKARLFDYECITRDGRDDAPRLVAFGKYAGIAGMIDCLQGLGQRLLAEGYSTPFLNVPLAYMFQNLDQARVTLRTVGSQIEGTTGIPEGLSPIVFAFTGNGNVSQGAQEMFSLLPHEWVTAEELPTLKNDVLSGKRNRNTLYGIIVEPRDMVSFADGKPLTDMFDYFSNPQKYVPIFHEKVAPYITALVNGMYWDSRYPRLLSNRQISNLRSQGNRNLRFLADISCDIGGSVEFLSHSTVIEKPFYSFNPETGLDSEDFSSSGIGVSAVDILPSELPRDSSEHFGRALMPLLPAILRSQGSRDQSDMSDISPEFRRACIASHGELQPKWAYISQLRRQSTADESTNTATALKSAPSVTQVFEMKGHLFDSALINRVLDALDNDCPGVTYKISKCIVQPNQKAVAVPSSIALTMHGNVTDLKRAEDKLRHMVENHPNAAASFISQGSVESKLRISSMKRVVLFGAGRVAGPVLKLLGSHDNVTITVASDNEEQANQLRSCIDLSKTSFVQFKLPDDLHKLSDVMKNCDVAISLLPATLHLPIAEEAIKQQKHLVTSSYVSPGMRALHDRAVAAGVVLLNEAGLDPGIDHLLIMKAIDSIHSQGGVVEELVSLCGGLPDPVAADNPLRYKFSWSPRGVMSAAGNEAIYLSNGKVIKVPGEKLLLSAMPSHRFPTMRLETLPNRDSLLYKDLYNIPKAHSICRGTLRYEGWSNSMYGLKALDLFDNNSIPAGIGNWKSLLCEKHKSLVLDSNGDISLASLKELLKSRGVLDVASAANAIKWLGILSSAALPSGSKTPMDALSMLLENTLTFKEGEKDMVAMYHTVTGRMPDGSSEEITSSLLAFGLSGASGETAMAATVGYTAGAAAELVLLDKVSSRGVIIPTSPELYNPLLARLKDFGISWSETVIKTAK